MMKLSHELAGQPGDTTEQVEANKSKEGKSRGLDDVDMVVR